MVLCVFLSSTLIIANPDISSINGDSTFINLCSFGFNTMHSFGKIGKDLFKKLKQPSCELKTLFNSNIILIPKPKSMFLCISDSNEYISNLYPCISTIISIMNKTLTNYPFPTWILFVLDANFGREWSDIQCK